MKQNILDAKPKAKICVYAVWFNMYPGDHRGKWARALLPEGRTIHYWDERRLTGTWFARHGKLPGVYTGSPLWDAFLAYDKGAEWTGSVPAPLLTWGRTIVSKSSRLTSQFLPLLK